MRSIFYKKYFKDDIFYVVVWVQLMFFCTKIKTRAYSKLSVPKRWVRLYRSRPTAANITRAFGGSGLFSQVGSGQGDP